MSPPPSQINTSVSAQTMVSGRDTIPAYRSMSIVRQGVHKSASVDRSLVRPSPEEHDNDVGVRPGNKRIDGPWTSRKAPLRTDIRPEFECRGHVDASCTRVKKDEAMNKASETCQQGQQQAGGFMQQHRRWGPATLGALGSAPVTGDDGGVANAGGWELRFARAGRGRRRCRT
ncbi:hypothetical protein BHM03_00001330 [Ensete ventricosum]|nr:hypothetical protein BHM03_00001330 [Ensete ventricosum]